jgi:TPR repeat protein
MQTCGEFTFVAAVLIAIAATPLPVIAADPGNEAETVASAIRDHDYAKILPALVQRVEKGDPKLQGTLGVMYFDGIGLTKDFTEAFKWNQKAAAQGRPESAWRLQIAYFNGLGVKSDIPESQRWRDKANALGQPLAEKGDALAEEVLGKIAYERREFKQAADWYQRAVKHGLPAAYGIQIQLSCDRDLLREIGEKLDSQKCDLEVFKAAEMGNSHAQASLGRHYAYPPLLPNGQLAESDDKQAKYWWSRAAALGDAYAHRELKHNYAIDIGPETPTQPSWVHEQPRPNDSQSLDPKFLGGMVALDLFIAAIAPDTSDNAKPDEVARQKTELAQAQANAGTKSELQNAETTKTEPEAVFTNYSHPKLFDVIYRGTADSSSITDLEVIFLQEFLQNSLKNKNCNHLVSDATFLQISTKAEIAAFRNQISDLLRTQKQHRPTTGPIDYGGLFREGMEAALGPLGAASREIINAQKDSLLFLTQYGCDGPVPNRFFENMGIFVRRL